MFTRIPTRRIAAQAFTAATTTTTTITRSRCPILFQTHRRLASSFTSQPGPPKLPAKEQAEFERLQREAEVSSAFQPESTETSSAAAASTSENSAPSSAVDSELNEGGGLYRGAKPEFEGDKNPRTGEVGGPKNEPLRWGSGGDWSYNGKVTDF